MSTINAAFKKKINMFVLRKNLITLSKYTKSVCKSVTILNKFNSLECHESTISQFCLVKRWASSHPLGPSSRENAKNLANSGKEGESSNPLPDDLKAITKGNKELEYKLKVLMLETEVLRQEGRSVPDDEFMTPEVWENLLKLPSRSARMKQLGFIFKNSKKKENRLAKKLEKRKIFEEQKATREESPKHLPMEEHALKYGLMYNNIFLRFQDAFINHFYNSKLIQAMQFGQKLVIDCGYDQNMTKRENHNAAKQLMLLFSENRNNADPFDVYYTNINKESELTTKLYKYIPTMYDREFPMNIHEKSYLDLFPKQKLIYLTPHCREEMDTFDCNAIYIIGAIVDKVNNEPLSLAKAKREGIVMKKFPLDRYLNWGSGSGKNLTLNQCIAILLDLKATGDWKHALRHVPKRKLLDPATVVDNMKNRSFRPLNKTKTWKPSKDKYSGINVKSF